MPEHNVMYRTTWLAVAGQWSREALPNVPGSLDAIRSAHVCSLNPCGKSGCRSLASKAVNRFNAFSIDSDIMPQAFAMTQIINHMFVQQSRMNWVQSTSPRIESDGPTDPPKDGGGTGERHWRGTAPPPPTTHLISKAEIVPPLSDPQNILT